MSTRAFPSMKIVPLSVTVFVARSHEISPNPFLHEYEPDDGVRLKVFAMLRFIFVASGELPWSLSNAFAQLAAFVGVPLDVEHGKYGPGLADLYQPAASVFGGLSV